MRKPVYGICEQQIVLTYILSVAMHLQNFIKIHKILSINEISTSIKGNDSLKNWPKIMCFRNNMDLVFINAYTKFYQNSSIWSADIEEKHIFTSIKGQNSVVYKQIKPICNHNHSSLISMSMRSLKKIGKKLLKLRVRKQHFYINQGLYLCSV